MPMDPFTLGELSVAVAAVMGAVTLAIRQCQRSRCATINVCFGCLRCEREVPAEDENAQTKPEESAPAGVAVVRDS